VVRNTTDPRRHSHPPSPIPHTGSADAGAQARRAHPAM